MSVLGLYPYTRTHHYCAILIDAAPGAPGNIYTQSPLRANALRRCTLTYTHIRNDRCLRIYIH
eukprot:12206005-Alexandrium_andersonii.AAC.1